MSDILNWITDNNLFWLIIVPAVIVPAASWILIYFLNQRKENNASNRKDNVIKAIKEILNEENPKFPNKTRSITAIVKGVNTKISGNIEDSSLIVSVHDSGKGIGAYHNLNGGNGLGLFIVKYLLEQQSGKLEMKSKKNIGTKAMVTLPFNIKS